VHVGRHGDGEFAGFRQLEESRKVGCDHCIETSVETLPLQQELMAATDMGFVMAEFDYTIVDVAKLRRERGAGLERLLRSRGRYPASRYTWIVWKSKQESQHRAGGHVAALHSLPKQPAHVKHDLCV
jgi:hypothetical protein